MGPYAAPPGSACVSYSWLSVWVQSARGRREACRPHQVGPGLERTGAAWPGYIYNRGGTSRLHTHTLWLKVLSIAAVAARVEGDALPALPGRWPEGTIVDVNSWDWKKRPSRRVMGAPPRPPCSALNRACYVLITGAVQNQNAGILVRNDTELCLSSRPLRTRITTSFYSEPPRRALA